MAGLNLGRLSIGDDDETACIVCNKPDAHFCNRCKSARYCSQQCQQIDWPTHRLLCRAFSDFDVSARPSDECRRALFFPVEGKMKLVWLHFRVSKYDDEEDPWDRTPDTDPFLGPDCIFAYASIAYNTVLERSVDNSLGICYRDTFLMDGSKPNKSVAAITATKPGELYEWRGPMLAYTEYKPSVDHVYPGDFSMRDFRNVTDFFLTYRANLEKPVLPSGETVKGVRVNCLGDRKMLKRPQFEAVDVPVTNAIFLDHDVSEITKRIGIPIFTWQCRPHPKWAYDESNKMFEHESPYNNQLATFLHLSCNPNSPFNFNHGTMGWGFPSMKWQNDVGSAVIVRQDRKPLHPAHAEALCKYCMLEVAPMFRHSNGEFAPEEPMAKKDVLAMITRPLFAIYWNKLQEEKYQNGDHTSVPSPYDPEGEN
ncbi:hypothetical protein GGS23DRAFT_362464 [Durotheca rogersii]|uniref:uncharacterized protein n=1 Tax=Durotheca rogersii TaxID=419775 RepID=UPI0022203B27|nr:uncharacterized protein GGS23DRAFT_362464 [Durotheca rogersii]KAI5865960.1 hypothetical protein GGS23DRAFT_362464 [Durotheca rogersii]